MADEEASLHPGELAVLSRSGIDRLITELGSDGYRVVGPRERDGSIVYDTIGSSADLPVGWGEEQDGGKFRLRRRGDGALFGYSVGPHSLKQLLFVPTLKLVQLRRSRGSFVRVDEPARAPRVAVLGARSCDLAGADVQDRVFGDGPYADPDYVARREHLFVVAVQCGQAGGTCFCVSMKTGPRATRGFDLALTELLDGEHRFVVEVGTERGAAVLARVTRARAPEPDVREAEEVSRRTEGRMGRTLDTTDIRDLFMRNLEHPRWDDVAARCLGCTSCTLVCPTCFCSTVEDVTDLSGETAARERRWDSCFTLDHSYVHGGSVRTTVRSRYRQWLTHKLATWIDQFQTSGCVGCGRCITWCPVAIDITAEAAAIRAADGQGPAT